MFLWTACYGQRVYPLQRPRFASSHVYAPLDDQRELREYLKSKKPELPFRCDLWLECLFVFKQQTADVDNLLKAIQDGLQWADVIDNDRKIRGFNCAHGIGAMTQVHIILREVMWYDSAAISAGGFDPRPQSR